MLLSKPGRWNNVDTTLEGNNTKIYSPVRWDWRNLTCNIYHATFFHHISFLITQVEKIEISCFLSHPPHPISSNGNVLQSCSTVSKSGYWQWCSPDTEHFHHHKNRCYHLLTHLPTLTPTPDIWKPWTVFLFYHVVISRML